MASSAVSTSFSKCQVCQESPQNPRALPCKHIVCTHCLQQHVASGSTKERVECPSCGTPFNLPNGGVNEVPVAEKCGNAIEQLCQTLQQCTGSVSVQLKERKLRVAFRTDTDVCGIVVVGNCLCIILKNTPYIHMYDPVKGNKATEVPHVSSLQGMVLLSSSLGMVVLLDKTESKTKLHYVKIADDLSVIHLREKDIALSDPCSIHLSEQSEELLISQGGPEFAICTPEGDVKKLVNVGIDSKLACVLRDRGSYLLSKRLVLQHSPPQLQWVDENGKDTGVGGGRKIQCGPHMIHDNVGRVIATDRENNRVILIDSRGIDIATKFLLTVGDNIKSPHYLHLHNSLLYIAHTAQVIRIKRYQDETTVSTYKLCS